MVREGDLVEVVEQCYSLGGSEAQWLQGLLDAMPASFDRGLGTIAASFELRKDKPAILVEVVGRGAEGIAEAYVAAQSPACGLSEEQLAIGHRATFGGPQAYGSVSECFARDGIFVPQPQQADEVGARDMVAIHAVEPSGGGVIVGAPLPKPLRTSARDRRRFGNVAAHIAAGMRLRRALASGGGLQEAILAPNGTFLDAEAAAQSRSAQESLRQAAKAIDKARGKLRCKDELEALEIWRGLCAGRWSLVDQFDSDGRRYIIARRNEPDVNDPRRLSPRERQIAGLAALGRSNKYIAYALGVSASCVGSHLTSAARKLGVRTRVELIATLGALGVGAPTA